MGECHIYMIYYSDWLVWISVIGFRSEVYVLRDCGGVMP